MFLCWRPLLSCTIKWNVFLSLLQEVSHYAKSLCCTHGIIQVFELLNKLIAPNISICLLCWMKVHRLLLILTQKTENYAWLPNNFSFWANLFHNVSICIPHDEWKCIGLFLCDAEWFMPLVLCTKYRIFF